MADLAVMEPAVTGQPGTSPARRRLQWLFHVLLVVPAALLLWSSSMPGGGFLSWVLAFLWTGAMALLWLAWGIDYVVRRRRLSWWFLVAPTVGLLVAALYLSDLPLHARFAMSRPAFDRVAHQPAPENGDGRVGLYSVGFVRADGDELWFSQVGGCLFCDAGFVYAPYGVRTEPGVETGHLSGPWYWYVDGD